MHLLTRTVRFTLDPSTSSPHTAAGLNGHGGKPPIEMLGVFCELDVVCEGKPDPETGYLINIKAIDDAAHREIIPAIVESRAQSRLLSHAVLAASRAASSSIPVSVYSVTLRPSPYMSMEARVPCGTVIIKQQLEFSAAHRLHVPSLSEAENRDLFGKCNNPSGHGHNYRIEPAVEVDPDCPMPVGAIERITDEVVIERFDHKHLNEQTTEFASEGGVNPSVENIARVCFELLQGPIADEGGTLRAVTVWETDRTSSTYPA